MTKIEQALSEIKRRAVRTDLLVWGPGSVGVEPVTCICITEDALREALAALDTPPAQEPSEG